MTFIPDNDREERAVAERGGAEERGTGTPAQYVINFRGPGAVRL